ncbi:hypothetical protein DUNSADRAFT_5994 [Dunaliella salina]|uniref:Encoded protein n=1 Tax=Dunaliella salina TaxID=3046 RepID=A0ABQ7FU03_DUNSA|nr:hypothetical protein DUNSADRAFT_5994 [Dunaliella salina]|eukprot:KAF5825909.1 hypothetical protein DUNSADRAFT_5994 [Dunaliella salina]
MVRRRAAQTSGICAIEAQHYYFHFFSFEFFCEHEFGAASRRTLLYSISLRFSCQMVFDVLEKGLKGVANTSKDLAEGGLNLGKDVAQDGVKLAGHATGSAVNMSGKAAGWTFDTTKEVGSGVVKGTGSALKSGADTIKGGPKH